MLCKVYPKKYAHGFCFAVGGGGGGGGGCGGGGVVVGRGWGETILDEFQRFHLSSLSLDLKEPKLLRVFFVAKQPCHEEFAMHFNSLWPGDAIWREIWVNTSSGNGLLPDGTTPLPEPMLTDRQ